MGKDAQSREQRSLMMTNEAMPRLILKMSLPTIIAFIINSIYSLADTYFVSSLGTNATAAVSVNSSLDMLIMMCGSLLAVGANSYIARLLGEGKKEKASQVLSTAFFGAFGLGVLMMVGGLLFMGPLVRLLGATPTCEAFSIEYATYVLYAAPFMSANFVMNQCLRSEGSATLSMLGMGLGGILNCVLDPIFIFNLDMGVAGASLATAVSKVFSFGILIFPYLTRRSLLHLSVRNCRVSRDIVSEIATVGSSSFFRTGLSIVSSILLNNLAGDISDSVLAAVGVCTKIMMFPFGIILGFAQGFQPVAGFNWGAKRYDRVRESYRFSARVSVIGGTVMAILLIVFVKPLIIAFAGTDTDMLGMGIICMVSQAICLPIHSFTVVVNMYCAGLGRARDALILSTTRQGTCFIPVLYPLYWLFREVGVVCTQAVADLLSLVVTLPILRRIQKAVDEAEQAELVATPHRTQSGFCRTPTSCNP